MRGSFVILSLLLVALCVVAIRSAPYPLRDVDRHTESLDGLASVRAPLATEVGDQVRTGGGSPSAEPSMAELVQLAQQLLDQMRSEVQDYSATLVKRERIGGVLAPETRMEIKIRNPQLATDVAHGETSAKQLSVYLKFAQPDSQRGREVIWEGGKRENKLIAHESGFLNLMSVQLKPDSTLAMRGNKYPITEIGLMRLLEKMLEKIDRNVDLSRCRIETRENQRVGDRECRLFQVTQPRSIAGADFYIAQFFLDTERQLPLRYAAFLWPEKEGDPPPLEEEYTYLDLQTNVGLSDADFDPKNPQYDFP